MTAITVADFVAALQGLPLLTAEQRDYYSGTKDCRTDGSSVLFRTDWQSVLPDLLS